MHTAKTQTPISISILSIRILVVLFLTVLSTNVLANWQSRYHIHGYDPVSYFVNSTPVMGTPDYTATHEGNTYAFSSQENMQTFQNQPERFVPAYDANCAFGMVYGKQSDIDPLVYTIVDDRLFFMINASTKKRWSKKTNKNIRKGDFYWNKVVGTTSARER